MVAHALHPGMWKYYWSDRIKYTPPRQHICSYAFSPYCVKHAQDSNSHDMKSILFLLMLHFVEYNDIGIFSGFKIAYPTGWIPKWHMEEA